MASFGGQSGGSNKITKARGKMVMVKPILKKLPRSEKNSLDLDRGWDEQQVEQLENGWDGGYGYPGYGYGYGGQARDVSFGFSGAPGDGGSSGMVTAGGGGSSFRAKFQHGRSGSQTSTASGGPPRAGFVHPFAQTPRTSTPPLSYANSLASFDNGRDCSPTITENEDDDGFDTSAYPHPQPHSHSHTQPITISQSSNLRRPSLNSQRTASFPDTYPLPPPKPPSLRINTTGRSISGTTTTTTTSSRLAHGSSLASSNHSDLHLNTTHSHSLGNASSTIALDSPTGSFCGGAGVGTPLHSSTPPPQPPPSLSSQMSPLRTSLDLAAAGFPRLRSRSELDTASRAENIRVARRKFEEREKIKEEKYDREMIRKRERRDNKEACRIEKGEVVSSPGSGGSGSGSGNGNGGGGGIGTGHSSRPPAPRRRITPTGLGLSITGVSSAPPPVTGEVSGRDSPAPTRSSSPFLGGLKSAASAPVGATGLGVGIIGRRRHTDSPSAAATTSAMAEKQPQMGFASRKYESVPLETPPAFGAGPAGVEDVRFEQMPPRRGSAKRKTQGYWQGFILWLRTKLLRLGGK